MLLLWLEEWGRGSGGGGEPDKERVARDDKAAAAVWIVTALIYITNQGTKDLNEHCAMSRKRQRVRGKDIRRTRGGLPCIAEPALCETCRRHPTVLLDTSV